MTKYIFITGGVVSSLGKGIVAASLGSILDTIPNFINPVFKSQKMDLNDLNEFEWI